MINLSTGAFYERSATQIGALRARAENLQKQIGTGERLEKSSDDPVAAARLRMLDREERISKVDTRNSEAAENNLKFTDQALSQMTVMISRARELALHAANATTSDEQRASIATELDGLRQCLRRRSRHGRCNLCRHRDAGRGRDRRRPDDHPGQHRTADLRAGGGRRNQVRYLCRAGGAFHRAARRRPGIRRRGARRAEHARHEFRKGHHRADRARFAHGVAGAHDRPAYR